MKKIKYLIVFSLSLICIHFYGMKRAADSGSFGGAASASAGGGAAAAAVPFVAPPIDQPLVQTFFVPQNDIKYQLFSLLDSAQRQVLIAMYYITDNDIVRKLLEVKRRGVDIKIIFDESSTNSEDFMRVFLGDNIIPIMFPSSYCNSTCWMHNKFVIIDDSVVWTGSANFTKQGFAQNLPSYNNENIVILRSKDIVQQYKRAFVEIEERTFNTYMKMIASNAFPSWFNQLFLELYTRDYRIEKIRKDQIDLFEPVKKQRLEQFFAAQPIRGFLRPTQGQKDILEKYGVLTNGMSRSEAFALIGKIIKD